VRRNEVGAKECLPLCCICDTLLFMKTAIIHARIEPSIKRKAESVLQALGLSPTEAIRMFYRQITLRGGLPFAVIIPNEQTAAALKKSRRGEDVEEFADLDQMFESWKK
jgi:DNA-damage-inducible protein J